MERPGGLSLIELLFTLTIVAGLLGWTVPVFRNLQRDSVRTAEVNLLVRGIHLARGEALRRNLVVSLCPSLDGADCARPGTPWHLGWIVFVNRDRDNPATRDSGEELLHVHPEWKSGTISANRATLSLRAFGQSGVTATFAFCDDRGSVAARAVVISQTGRPRISDRSASGSPLVCP